MNGVVPMSLKDRGNIKWKSAMFLPEHVKLLKNLNKDYYRQAKPILDEYQIEEFENKIHNAMEFSSPVKFTVWEDGFDWEYTGLLHRLEPKTNLIHLELEKEKGYIIKIKFEDIVEVEVKE
ncbi:YolD-like family protein [Peribacillus butanolivorans]|uniref:YolD-like family protein n=2 Tax=Peribacillus butanolivorans TaxID=421767 RepID=UPI0036DF862D